MTQQRSQTQKTPVPDQLDKFIDLQKLKYQNETKELFLREKDQESQANYAHRLLDYQAEIEKKRPEEHRKTIITFAWIFAVIMLLAMVFAAFCIYHGKEEFLYNLLRGLGYLITTLMGYWFGKRLTNDPNKKALNDDIQDF